MKIVTAAVAGTLESSDVYVKVEPCETLEIQIESVVYQQYGSQIRACVADMLDLLDVQQGKISIQDKGALDCVIRARVETAVKRGGEA